MWAFFLFMADNIKYSEDISPQKSFVNKLEQMINYYASKRTNFERTWYDNNFFDDGYHFRYVSRTTGKIVDLNDKTNRGMPQRAIPKASRQLRGIANLLLGPEYRPVAYPDEGLYISGAEGAKEKAKQDAKYIGLWLEDEWDDLGIKEKLIHMVLLTGKHGVSYLKVWDEGEKFKASVRDAFDLYLAGNVTDIEDSPAVIEATPRLIADIQADKRFDQEARQRLSPDNKYASSEVKDAYMKSTFGTGSRGDQMPTVIQKEVFMKVRIDSDNAVEVFRDITKAGLDPEEFERGDTVIKHCFVAGGELLFSEYLGMDEYPYVDFRMEPGPIYQTPLMNRFIPANKTLDIIMSRIERYANTMITGTWMKRKGENFDITNVPGGQVIEYDGTPPVQGNMANIPPFLFSFLEMVNSQIEEQGAATSALNSIPTGVKSGIAIESLKATEYANLKIPSDQLKKTTKRIGEKMIRMASMFTDPKMVMMPAQKGEFEQFAVMGERGAGLREKLGQQVDPETVILRRDQRVDIEVESGLGFTMEGKKATMKEISTFMTELATAGLLSTEAVKVAIQKYLETYNFGATQEFMDAMEEGAQTTPLSQEQMDQMKIAVAEVMKDLGLAGPDAEEQQIQTTKVGVVEALQDTGMLEKQKPEKEDKGPSRSISFKDLPAEGKAQLAAQAGIELSPETIKRDEKEEQKMTAQAAQQRSKK